MRLGSSDWPTDTARSKVVVAHRAEDDQRHVRQWAATPDLVIQLVQVLHLDRKRVIRIENRWRHCTSPGTDLPRVSGNRHVVPKSIGSAVRRHLVGDGNAKA